jgi:hypothetical protein
MIFMATPALLRFGLENKVFQASIELQGFP